VQAILEDLGFPAHTIREAEASALGDEASEWGAYYASRPKVLVGDTRLAASVAFAQPLVQSLICGLRSSIDAAAATLRTARQQ